MRYRFTVVLAGATSALAGLVAAGIGSAGASPMTPFITVGLRGWLALFVAAVETGLPWARLRPRWEEFLLVRFATFVENGLLDRLDLPWLGRILGHRVAGAPLGQVADWVHAEVHRVAGLEPRA